MDEDRTSQAGEYSPNYDIYRTHSEVVVKIDLPGAKKRHITVKADDDELEIYGERRREKRLGNQRNYLIRERVFNTFERCIPIPVHVEPDTAQADYNNGVLEVRMNRPEEYRKHSVEIN